MARGVVSGPVLHDEGGRHDERALGLVNIALGALAVRESGPVADKLMREAARDAGYHEAVVDVLEDGAVLGREQVVDEVLDVAPSAREAHVAEPRGGFDYRVGVVESSADAPVHTRQPLIGQERGYLIPVNGRLAHEIDIGFGTVLHFRDASAGLLVWEVY